MTQEEPPAAPAPDRPCCEEFAQRISDHHDGRWPAGSCDCAEVEEHLAVCPKCARLLDDYRLLSKAAESLRAVKVSEDCAEVMRRRVRLRIRAQVFRRRLKWTGAGVAVAAAASVALAIAMLPDTDATAPGPPELAVDDGNPEDGAEGGAPDEIDLLRDPAVAALLRELHEEAMRSGAISDADAEADDGMTIQEEIDLRREWGVRRVYGIEPTVSPDELDYIRLRFLPRSRALEVPGVVPVGGEGQ